MQDRPQSPCVASSEEKEAPRSATRWGRGELPELARTAEAGVGAGCGGQGRGQDRRRLGVPPSPQASPEKPCGQIAVRVLSTCTARGIEGSLGVCRVSPAELCGGKVPGHSRRPSKAEHEAMAAEPPSSAPDPRPLPEVCLRKGQQEGRPRPGRPALRGPASNRRSLFLQARARVNGAATQGPWQAVHVPALSGSPRH